MDSTHPYECYCGCGGTIFVTFTGGFQGTTCKVTPCPKAPAYVLSFTVPRSAVLEMTPAGQVMQHADALVVTA